MGRSRLVQKTSCYELGEDLLSKGERVPKHQKGETHELGWNHEGNMVDCIFEREFMGAMGSCKILEVKLYLDSKNIIGCIMDSEKNHETKRAY